MTWSAPALRPFILYSFPAHLRSCRRPTPRGIRHCPPFPLPATACLYILITIHIWDSTLSSLIWLLGCSTTSTPVGSWTSAQLQEPAETYEREVEASGSRFSAKHGNLPLNPEENMSVRSICGMAPGLPLKFEIVDVSARYARPRLFMAKYLSRMWLNASLCYSLGISWCPD